jgi:hypothetical protein
MNGAQYENQQSTQPEADQAQSTGYGQAPERNLYPGRGYEAAAPGTTQRKSPITATILSCLPGLGQVYVGYYQQGFINILVVASTIAFLSSNAVRGMEPFFGVFLAFFWIFNMIDANRRAHHYNRAMAGLGGEDVPDDFKLPKGGGSLFGGVALVVIGIIFILDLNFDVSMAWIEDWWPVVLVAFGANLIYKARRKAE